MIHEKEYIVLISYPPTPLSQALSRHKPFLCCINSLRYSALWNDVCVCLFMCLCKSVNAAAIWGTLLISSCYCVLECIASGGRCGSVHPPTVQWHLFCSLASRRTDSRMGDSRNHLLCCGNKSAATQTPGIILPG